MPSWVAMLSVVVYGLSAIAALTGYILASRELSPVKTVLLGSGTIAAAWCLAYVADKLELVNLPHGEAGLFALTLWFLTTCGFVACVIGLLRFGLRFWRKS